MITLNEKQIDFAADATLASLAQRFKPAADIAVINGYPADADWNKIKINDNDTIVLIEKSATPTEAEFEALLTARHTPGVHKKIKSATVAIAGLGGLGSAVAAALVRTGIKKLILADFDVVEPSNLNRQYYFADQIGKHKTDATIENLKRINPFADLDAVKEKLTAQNICEYFKAADIIAECFDRADQKQMLTETVLCEMPDKILISASGLAGLGKSNDIKTIARSKNHYIVGDLTAAAAPGNGLMAPRVGIAAHHQANAIIEILVNRSEK